MTVDTNVRLRLSIWRDFVPRRLLALPKEADGELQADAEIERTYLLGDPLRGAFQPERDSDLSDLNLSVSIPAYVAD